MENNTILDTHTFGDSRAAEVLADMLTKHNNPHYTRKVSSFLSEHNKMLNQISLMTDPHVRVSFINMLADKVRQSRISNVPTLVESYTKNVAQRKIKRAREVDEEIMLNIRREQQIVKNSEKELDNP